MIRAVTVVNSEPLAQRIKIGACARKQLAGDFNGIGCPRRVQCWPLQACQFGIQEFQVKFRVVDHQRRITDKIQKISNLFAKRGVGCQELRRQAMHAERLFRHIAFRVDIAMERASGRNIVYNLDTADFHQPMPGQRIKPGCFRIENDFAPALSHMNDPETIASAGTSISKIATLCNRRQLMAELGAARQGARLAARGVIAAIIARRYRAAMTVLETDFWQIKSGRWLATIHSLLVDRLIRALADSAAGGQPVQLAIAAQGGYGRQQLAPYSDIDLLFIPHANAFAAATPVIEDVLYPLWDAGFKVGYAVRTPEEMVLIGQEDAVAAAAMLDARLVWGDPILFTAATQLFFDLAIAADPERFVAAKQAEAAARHARFGGTLVQPDLKEGPGGLRDVQTLAWMRTARGQPWTPADRRRLQRAEGVLLTLRCGLHFLAQKPQEQLSFVWQPELARCLGTRAPTPNRAAERLMRRFHLATRVIQQLGWEETATPDERTTPPTLSPRAALQRFLAARTERTVVTPAELAAIRRAVVHLAPAEREDPQAQALLSRLLTEPFPEAGRDLRQLADCGLLGTFLPDFGRTTGLMQFDQYHVYTVDAHTLAAMDLAHRLACGLEAAAFPLATQLWQGLRHKRVLMLAVLFHDIAKGRGGDHAVVGEQVALAVCPQLGCDADETAMIGWLVRQHLLLSFYAFKRDVQDPDTVRSFAGVVQTVERLRLLYLLTVIDIKATNPAILNSWKLSLLGELYTQTEDLLGGGFAEEGREVRIAAARNRLAAELTDWPEAVRAGWLAALPGPYWLAFALPEQRAHLEMLRQLNPDDPNDLVCRFYRNLAQDVTEVALSTRDRPGLFALFAGVMALAGTSIVEARIFTLDNGYVLDRFAVQEKGGAVRWDDRLERLADKVRAAWAGRLDVDAALRALPVDPVPVAAEPPHVGIDNTTSPRFTIVEVTAPDRRGLLFRLLTVLRDAGLQVMRAKISTFGATASDVFYLVDAAGGKIEDSGQLATLRQGLLTAMQAE